MPIASTTTTTTLGLFGSFGTSELIVLALIGILLFGKRLPEVGRSIGKGIVEFKKGLQGIEDDLDQATTSKNAKQPGQLPPQNTSPSSEASSAARAPQQHSDKQSG